MRVLSCKEEDLDGTFPAGDNNVQSVVDKDKDDAE